MLLFDLMEEGILGPYRIGSKKPGTRCPTSGMITNIAVNFVPKMCKLSTMERSSPSG